MGIYHTCPYCGANLDPGERCDCRLDALVMPPEPIDLTADHHVMIPGLEAVRRFVAPPTESHDNPALIARCLNCDRTKCNGECEYTPEDRHNRRRSAMRRAALCGGVT